jgi:hypothetical protein
VDALVLSNPHGNDGFYFPKEFYLRLYDRVRKLAPHLPVYSQENLNLAVFSVLEAGSLKDFLPLDEQLFVEDGLYPVLTPAGPEFAWLLNKNFSRLADRAALSPVAWDLTTRAFFSFLQKSGPSFLEFTRRKLATAQSIKVLGLYLSQALSDSSLRISHWPDAGLHIQLSLSGLFEQQGFTSAQDWCLKLAEKTGILLLPGDLWGQRHQLQICYAASPGYLDKMGPDLRLALTDLKNL